MKNLLLPLLFFIGCGTAHAQLTSCAQTLRLARSTYEHGRLREIPELLSRCLSNGFQQQEKVEAYKLLCLSYIYLEEPTQADDAMLKLLQTDHYFEINPSTDPAEFIALYRTFRTEPVYRFGGKIGANATQPNVVNYLPANDGKSKYTYGIGFQGGIVAEIPLTHKITLNSELTFSLNSFNYENVATHIELVTNEQRVFTIKAQETHAWVSLPLAVQYQVITSKFHPYISVGISTDYLLSANSKFRREKNQATSLDEQRISILSERNKFNISALASMGAKLKVTGGFAIAEIRYLYGLPNVNNNENIYALLDKTFPADGYVDGIFKLNSLNVTIGYVYNIFHPKKLKK